MAAPRFARSSTDWSSSRFSRRSTAHTCQPFAFRATSCASGTKYAALADVPGFSTGSAPLRPDLQDAHPVVLARVPGASNPAIRSKRGAASPTRAGATTKADEGGASPSRTTADLRLSRLPAGKGVGKAAKEAGKAAGNRAQAARKAAKR